MRGAEQRIPSSPFRAPQHLPAEGKLAHGTGESEGEPASGVARKAIIHCLAEGGSLIDSVDFAAEGGTCAVNFMLRYDTSCEAALARRIEIDKVPREQVIEE